MNRAAAIIALIFAVIYAAVIWACITPMDDATIAPSVTISPDFVIYVTSPPPYPEEDTMHYLTPEGVLIIYGHGAEDPE